MKIVSINSWDNGSTGTIMKGCARVAREYGYTCYTFSKKWITSSTNGESEHIYIGDYFLNRVHIKLAYYTGLHGCFSILPTLRLLYQIKKIKPDLIHLHNLHDWFINLPLLFHYIKKHNISVVWTLHDCWAFTGQCPHFDMVKCDKWKTGCCDCSQYKEYPATLFDNSKRMYQLKKKWFTGIQNTTIVTPSQWLADLVKQSFLKDYPVKVINNGIDLSVFKPTPSGFRQKYHCEDKYILLGVAYGWGKRKGLDVFVELSKRLDSSYQIVLVGTNDLIDKQLPDNIISIHRTQNQKELAEIYTAADLFVNPTREEVLGLVNIEATACGTPVITFNSGGSPECIDDTCGFVVVCDDTATMLQRIKEIRERHCYTTESCIKNAQRFEMNRRFKEYVDLYKSISDIALL